MDGRDLRSEWIDEAGIQHVDRDWYDLECSMLEMLIALGRRVSFESHGAPAAWFWKLVENLELKGYTDDIYEVSIAEEVDEVLNRLNDRTYLRSGHGGLFPLLSPHEDQRKVEIWYQMSTYLLEGHDVSRIRN